MLFAFKLISPRPTFAHDMTEVERKVMVEHVAYWTSLMEKGIAVVYGPVLDPKGAWGLAVVETSTEAEARAIVSNDPVFKTRLGTIEVHPMSPRSIVRPGPA
jgi:uncharacterized protein